MSLRYRLCRSRSRILLLLIVGSYPMREADKRAVRFPLQKEIVVE